MRAVRESEYSVGTGRADYLVYVRLKPTVRLADRAARLGSLGATGTNDLPEFRTAMNNGPERGRGHGLMRRVRTPAHGTTDLKVGSMREEGWVASPEPAVGGFTTAGTCHGRLRRHCVIGCAAPDRTRLPSGPAAIGFGEVAWAGQGTATAPGRPWRWGTRPAAVSSNRRQRITLGRSAPPGDMSGLKSRRS